MAQYRVTVWDTSTMTRVRPDAFFRTHRGAFHAYESAIYDVLLAYGKLDTMAAYKAMDLAKRHDDILHPSEERGVNVSNTAVKVSIVRDK